MQTLHLFFKKGYQDSKEKYRPVTLLPVTSKIFEKILCRQLTIFADQNLKISVGTY